MNRAFTIIELLVSISIFVIMTTVVVSRYGNFNQDTLLTDTAYDIALVLRSAQTYGLSVKNAEVMTAPSFVNPYGVDFAVVSADCGAVGQTTNTKIVLFADTNPLQSPNHICTSDDTTIEVYKLLHKSDIYHLCAGTSSSNCTPAPRLTVSYQRPNPEAIICTNGSTLECGHTYAEARIRSSDGGNYKFIQIFQNGQITVKREY